ncbi:MAG: substrate import-associated zinc metallohydrolase lipoprotein [Cyclobacteriaceae bacterium]
MMSRLISSLFCLSLVFASSCYTEDPVDIPVNQVEPSTDEIDQFIQTEFVDKYGVAVRYRFVDRYVDPTRRVAPPRRELVQPILDFLLEYWIEPFLEVPNGEQFFKDHVPAEIVLIGSFIFNDDGTVVLGTADSGARITLTEVNNIDETDPVWVSRQLGTIFHEFAHIIHQRYNLPANFQQISPQGYTSLGSWFTLTDDEALRRGYVSPYATSTFNEDYAETAAFILFDQDFFDNYIEEENCTTPACQERNDGRVLIRQKFNTVIEHFRQNTGVDLLEVRARIQEKL